MVWQGQTRSSILIDGCIAAVALAAIVAVLKVDCTVREVYVPPPPLIVVHARGSYTFPDEVLRNIDKQVAASPSVLWLYLDDEEVPATNDDAFISTAAPDSQQVSVTGDRCTIVGGYWRACVMSVIAGVWRANPQCVVRIPIDAVAYGERTPLRKRRDTACDDVRLAVPNGYTWQCVSTDEYLELSIHKE